MHQIVVSGIEVEVVRKDIKNLHLGVYPPDGRVRAAVPLLVNDEAVRLAVISRLDWIKRQKARFQDQLRQTTRAYTNRESHYFQGRRYLLNVIEQDGPAKVVRRGKATIDLYVPVDADILERERAMNSWYREELKTMVPPLIEKWSRHLGIEVAEWRIKRMKTKWGSCNPTAKRIWLNLELAKKPVHCVEYVIVHEMVHMFEKHHGAGFQEIMDRSMPQWRSYRDELNQTPLGHEKWKY